MNAMVIMCPWVYTKQSCYESDQLPQFSGVWLVNSGFVRCGRVNKGTMATGPSGGTFDQRNHHESLERWSCNRGASCVVEYTMGRLRDWSL